MGHFPIGKFSRGYLQTFANKQWLFRGSRSFMLAPITFRKRLGSPTGCHITQDALISEDLAGIHGWICLVQGRTRMESVCPIRVASTWLNPLPIRRSIVSRDKITLNYIIWITRDGPPKATQLVPIVSAYSMHSSPMGWWSWFRQKFKTFWMLTQVEWWQDHIYYTSHQHESNGGRKLRIADLLIHRGIHWTSYAVPWVRNSHFSWLRCSVVFKAPFSFLKRVKTFLWLPPPPFLL